MYSVYFNPHAPPPSLRRGHHNHYRHHHAQEYRQLAHQAQALEVLLPLVQEAAELSEGRLHMVEEDHALLDALELAKWRLKRRISDMANENFGSIFR